MGNLVPILRFLSRFTLVLMLLSSAAVSAASIPHGTVDLVAENQWIVPGQQTYFALNFQLEKGWHIYWVNPGDSGQPLRIEWYLPSGLSAGGIEWPVPRRLGTSTIVDFGYEDGVALLIPIRSSSALSTNQTAKLGANLKVLVCREICIPGKAQVAISLPVKSAPHVADARSGELFAAARKMLPKKAPRDWEFHVSDPQNSFVLNVKLGRIPKRAIFFPLEESQVDNSPSQKFALVTGGFELTLRKSDQLLKPIRRLKGVLEFSADQAYLVDVAIGDERFK